MRFHLRALPLGRPSILLALLAAGLAASAWRPPAAAGASAAPLAPERAGAWARADSLRRLDEVRLLAMLRALPASHAAPAASGGPDDGTWEEIAPPARSRHSTIYDPAGHRLVVFGGYDSTQLPSRTRSDVWVLNVGGHWERAEIAGQTPGPRVQHAAIYDAPRGRMLVCGGSADPGVWSLSLGDAPVWEQLEISGPDPGARAGASVICDEARDRLLLFGGLAPGGAMNDLWALPLSAASAWQPLSVAGDGPDPQWGSPAVYDAARGRFLLLEPTFAGARLWALPLGGSPAWEEIPLAGEPVYLDPGARAVYDAAGDRVLLTGNMGFDHFDLYEIQLAGAPAGHRLLRAFGEPPGRVDHSFLLDTARGRLLVYGGQDDFGIFYNDAWELDLAQPPAWAAMEAGGPVPLQREGHSALLDASRGRMVIFGGGPAGAWGSATMGHEAWALDLTGGGAWGRLDPAGAPPPDRIDHSAVLDPRRERMLVFGGLGGTDLGDVWALSLQGAPAWSELLPGGSAPAARFGPASFYDPIRDRLLAFGGASAGAGVSFDDLWALNLAGSPAWERLAPEGVAPPPDPFYAAVYDDLLDRALVYGPQSGRFWELALAGTPRWTELFPLGTAPPALDRTAVSFDPARRRLLVAGGHPADQPFPLGTSQVWSLALAGTPQWSELLPAGTPPTARYHHTAVFDAVRDRMLLFGGTSGTEYWTNTVAALRFDFAPTSTVLLEVETESAPDRVRLVWLASRGRVSAATLQRRGEGEAWSTRARLTSSDGVTLSFDDRDVTPGARLGYRLGLGVQGAETYLGEVWVEVPATPALAVRGIFPAGGRPGADLTLASAAPARLELIDLQGRRLAHWEVGALGPGRHRVDLPGAEGAPAGLYLLRLHQGGQVAAAKAALLH